MALATLPGLGGCAHIYGDVSALQDPKAIIKKDAVFAMPDVRQSPDVNLQTRLDYDAVAAQMKALGYKTAVGPDGDYLMQYTVTDREMPMTYGETVPTMYNTMGDINGHPINGTTFGDMVVPVTHNVTMTTFEVTLQLLPQKLVVWQGTIEAEAEDARHYRDQFFHALLAHLGETAHGAAQLDTDTAPAKQP